MTEIVPARPLSKSQLTLACLAMGLGLFWFAWTVLLWYRLHPHLPWRDVFVILDDLRPLFGGESPWANLQMWIEPHYAAHRIAIPRILVALDVNYFGAQNHLLYAAAWSAITTYLVIFLRSARLYFGSDKISWYFCSGLVLTLIFAPAHLWNLINAINGSWHITFACGLGAVYILSKRQDGPQPRDWIFAYLLATIGAFTTFAGVIIWLVLPLFALDGSKRTLIMTSIASLLFTLGYLDGLSSDAQIAAAWDGGDPQIMNRIKATGTEAIAHSSPAALAGRTLKLLAWPLSATNPLLGAILVAMSLVFLGAKGLEFLREQLGFKTKSHPWLRLCLLMATIALGVAIAIGLGRLIEQPNHADGPSYERYNTVIAIYWIGIIGLLCAAQQNFSNRYKLLTMISLLVVTAVLIAPAGDYLKEEVLSVEHAGKLFAAGEKPRLRPRTNNKLLRFTPEYIYSFEKIFKAQDLAYYRDTKAVQWLRYPPECEVGVFNLEPLPDKRTAIIGLQATLPPLLTTFTRDLLILKRQKMVARLYSRHLGDYTPLSLISPSKNNWTGHMGAKLARQGQLQIMANNIGPTTFQCRIGALGTTKAKTPNNNAPQVALDV
ncbi:MAG: hypothetical protein V7709_10000 [Halioglobus sp.]